MALSLIPEHRNLLGNHLEIKGVAPQRTFTAVFEYPDCIRKFDGRTWTIIPHGTSPKAINI